MSRNTRVHKRPSSLTLVEKCLNTKRNQDWFDDEIEHLNTKKDITCQAKREAPRATPDSGQRKPMKFKILQKQVSQKGFCSATKASHHGYNPLWSKDRQKILKTDDEIKACWNEHFEELLNQRKMVDEEVLDRFPQCPMKEGIGDRWRFVMPSQRFKAKSKIFHHQPWSCNMPSFHTHKKKMLSA